MDGGTISIDCLTEKGEAVTISLVQHVSDNYYLGISMIPGRIYLGDTLVEKRSELEELIVTFIEEDVLESLSDIEDIVRRKVEWIKSDEYFVFTPKKNNLLKNRVQKSS